MDHYKAKGAEYEEAIVELSDLRQVLTEMACRCITFFFLNVCRPPLCVCLCVRPVTHTVVTFSNIIFFSPLVNACVYVGHENTVERCYGHQFALRVLQSALLFRKTILLTRAWTRRLFWMVRTTLLLLLVYYHYEADWNCYCCCSLWASPSAMHQVERGDC